MEKISRSEITPEHVYVNRRKFMVGAAALLGSSVLAACAGEAGRTVDQPAPNATSRAQAPSQQSGTVPQGRSGGDELGNALTPLEAISNYTNYYEFSLEKEGVASLTGRFETSPWKVAVGGLVRNPKEYALEELLEFGQEERIYRLRCVEGWSMVIPWLGFPLRKLLEKAEPRPEARFVRFQTKLAPEQMPGQRMALYPWPYAEGLRLDEAEHELTILATGLYGESLTVQNGAPIRLVVPWKYGFKSIKSIDRIECVAEMPSTFWASSGPDEYGFYANVNPDVPHPRWSQASERRIGESGRRKTLLYNGYAEEVAPLYEGMDPKVLFR